jgi:hypothetical protein
LDRIFLFSPVVVQVFAAKPFSSTFYYHSFQQTHLPTSKMLRKFFGPREGSITAGLQEDHAKKHAKESAGASLSSPPTAAAVPAFLPNDNTTNTTGWMVAPDVNPEPRRSGRERSSTTMVIDGHTVLKQNNYVVKGGDYVFGTTEDAAPSSKPPPLKKIKSTTSSVPRAPRVMSQVQRDRQAHNALVMQAKQAKQALQLSFLAKHSDRLAPFCEPKVMDTLKQVQQVPYQEIVITKQPQLIQTAVLRDYQMTGLNFMVNMHRQNLSMILGDEMGLVRTYRLILMILMMVLIIYIIFTHNIFSLSSQPYYVILGQNASNHFAPLLPQGNGTNDGSVPRRLSSLGPVELVQ